MIKTSQSKNGFTLIELLVVIAIIAILAAILFPVFAQAREKARQTTCTSNEKQIGLGILQYQQDFDEYFPMSQSYPGGNYATWQNSVDPYIKSGTAVGGGGITGGVQSCPDFPQPQEGSSYAISLELAAEDAGDAYPATDMTGPVQGLSVLDSPADTVIVAEMGANDCTCMYGFFDPQECNWADTMGTSAGNYLNYNHYDLLKDNPNGGGNENGGGDNTGGSSGDCDASTADIAAGDASGNGGAYDGCGMMPRYRHTQTSNFLFSDGHVKSVARGQLSWYRNIYVKGAYAAMFQQAYLPVY